MNHLLNERTMLHDRVKRHTRERDEAVRANRRAEYSLQASKDALKFTKIQCAEKKSAYARLKIHGVHKDLQEKRSKLLAQVVALQSTVLQQVSRNFQVIF